MRISACFFFSICLAIPISGHAQSTFSGGQNGSAVGNFLPSGPTAVHIPTNTPPGILPATETPWASHSQYDNVIEPSLLSAPSVYDPNPVQTEDQSYFAAPSGRPKYNVGVEIGVTGLVREAPDSQIIAVDGGFNELLNADDLGGSMQFGFRAFLDIHHLWDCLGGTDLELGYFGINSLDATRALAAPQVLPIFFNTIPASPLETGNIVYSSNVYSGEANLRFLSRRRFQPIAGLRFFKLEETYDNFVPSGGANLGGFSLTNNRLFGGQFGCQGTLYQSRYVEMYASGKLGLMNNQVEGAVRGADAGGNERVKEYSDNVFTTLTDVEAGLRFSLSGAIGFKVGYQFLFADEVATGPDQNASIALLSPGETVRFNSQQWHGLNLAADFRF